MAAIYYDRRPSRLASNASHCLLYERDSTRLLAIAHLPARISSDKYALTRLYLDVFCFPFFQCNAALGMKTLFDMLYAPPPKVMLFGDACNSVTDPIAKASRFFHLIQVCNMNEAPNSLAFDEPRLENASTISTLGEILTSDHHARVSRLLLLLFHHLFRATRRRLPVEQLSYADTHPMYTAESYPNFFRVVPSEAAFNPARVALFKHFNWTRVGTIYQNSPRYSLVSSCSHQ